MIKIIYTLMPEMNCEQTAMGLPSVMSAVFLIANFGIKLAI
jgi:hypothetical protein